MGLTAKQKREQRIAAAAAKEAGAPAGTPVTEIEKLNAKQFADPGSSPDAHGDVIRAPKKGGRTVTIGCKLSIAWFSMQLCKKTDIFEQNMQGGRKVPSYERVGPVVRIRGTAYPRGTPPVGFPAAPLIVAGAAMNPGIDADWWEAWVEQNKLNPIVINGMVFADEKQDRVHGIARETESNLSGLEPVNPKGDVRMPKSSRQGEVSEIEPGSRQTTAA